MSELKGNNRELRNKDIKIYEVFAEIDEPIFFSFEILIPQGSVKKKELFVATLADYEDETETDIYLVTKISKYSYNRMRTGKDQVRNIFRNSDDLFLAENIFSGFNPIAANTSIIKDYYPDPDIYLAQTSDGYNLVDNKEILRITKEMDPLNVINSSGIGQFLDQNFEKSYWHLSFGNSENNLTAYTLGNLLTTIVRLKDSVSDKKFELSPTKSFDGSFGLSFEIINDDFLNNESISENLEKLNTVFTLLNYEEYKLNPSLIENVFGMKITKSLEDFTKLLINNKLDFKSLYIESNSNNKSAGFIHKDTLEQIKYSLDKENIIEDIILILEGKLTKIDINKKQFGFDSGAKNIYGKISEKLTLKYSENDVDFIIKRVKNATIRRTTKIKGMSHKRIINYTLEDIEY